MAFDSDSDNGNFRMKNTKQKPIKRSGKGIVIFYRTRRCRYRAILTEGFKERSRGVGKRLVRETFK